MPLGNKKKGIFALWLNSPLPKLAPSFILIFDFSIFSNVRQPWPAIYSPLFATTSLPEISILRARSHNSDPKQICEIGVRDKFLRRNIIRVVNKVLWRENKITIFQTKKIAKLWPSKWMHFHCTNPTCRQKLCADFLHRTVLSDVSRFR